MSAQFDLKPLSMQSPSAISASLVCPIEDEDASLVNSTAMRAGPFSRVSGAS
jgi:hypothetical protein